MSNPSLNQLKNTVIRNCRISDARYAGNYTLCIYLLKMREFYRWEQNIPFGQNLSNDDIGQWLMDREAQWDELEEQDFNFVPVQDQFFSCYEGDKINALIEQDNLVYSGGYGNYAKPVFFLADLESKTTHEDYQLYICGHEYARELAAPPGMSQNQSIFIRKESLKRFIWEKYEESHWYNDDNPLARALACYPFAREPEQSLEQLAALEADTVLYHEIGEIQSSKQLGAQWAEMVMQMPRSKVEFMLRAIKDHIADAISTLPRLIDNHDEAQLHFYFANFKGMRRELFPSLFNAYEYWYANNDLSQLQARTEEAQHYWFKLAIEVLALFADKGLQSLTDIEQRIQKQFF